MDQEYHFSNEDFGLCSGYDELKQPRDMLKELSYESNDFVNLYLSKKYLKLNDQVTCLAFVGSKCEFSLSFDVNLFPPEEHIFMNLTSVPHLLSATSDQKSLYACSIGIIINGTPLHRIDFFIRRKYNSYMKRVTPMETNVISTQN